MNETSLSVSTIRRQRKAAVQSHAKELRSTFATFKQFQDTFLVLHWDGKIIQLMDGKTEDRLTIAVSSPCNLSGQFIASPAIAEGTGDTMAKCVFKIMNDFELIESVGALVFDTTASNTDQWRGVQRCLKSCYNAPCFGLHADTIYQNFLLSMPIPLFVVHRRVRMTPFLRNSKLSSDSST